MLGAIVTRSPSCAFAARALQFLDQACELFDLAKGRSLQPPNALVSPADNIPVLLLISVQDMMTNLQRKAHMALSQHGALQEEDAEGETDEFVALGAAGLQVEVSDKIRRGSPSSDDEGVLMYNSQAGIRSSTDVRGVSTSVSPTDAYSLSSRQSAHLHANYPEWVQHHPFFPPQPSSDGRETSGTPSSSGTGQLDMPVSVVDSDWPHGFMQSMGV